VIVKGDAASPVIVKRGLRPARDREPAVPVIAIRLRR